MGEPDLDAQLAIARDHVRALLAGLDDYRNALDAVLRLHAPATKNGNHCGHCKGQKWPCATAKAALAAHQEQVAVGA